MQKFIAVTALVAVAHAAELLTDAEQNSDGYSDGASSSTTSSSTEPIKGNGMKTKIDAGADTAANMGADGKYYKTGIYNDKDVTDDAHAQPLCSIPGFEDKVDNKGPSDQCCRTYDFVGWMGNYRDWCLYEDYEKVNWKNVEPKAYDLDQLGWHNDISSWKCGSKVMIKMCKSPADADYDESYDTPENCTEGHNHNSNMAADSQVMDTLWVKPQPFEDENAECVATVYELDDCMGEAFIIRSDIRAPSVDYSTLDKDQKWMGSWDHYDSTKDPLLVDGKIKSVMFKGFGAKRCVVEFFNANDFKGDSITVKSKPENGEMCHFVPHVEPVTDILQRNRWSENTGEQFEAGITTGVHSIQIRHEYFPETLLP